MDSEIIDPRGDAEQWSCDWPPLADGEGHGACRPQEMALGVCSLRAPTVMLTRAHLCR